ncbi:hypothetical protein ACFQ2B_00205 [Streptomyces stramineus]|uniref:Uncharacterized protein n=1 Tax=Streptomyces stramineus TaxID=173861 RepID=A0ABN1B220_9ACTN
MDENTAARRVLTNDEYQDAARRVREAARRSGTTLTPAATDDIVAALLTNAGLVAPPPEPEPGACTALFPDGEGLWAQCEQDLGHADEYHSDGELEWTDDHPDAVPPQC